MSVKRVVMKNKEGLPQEAFAIAGNSEDPETWKLPHHTKAIFKALAGKVNTGRTIDWEQMGATVAAISPRNRGQRIEASPEEILTAAKHLANHYQEAGSPLPDILAALV